MQRNVKDQATKLKCETGFPETRRALLQDLRFGTPRIFLICWGLCVGLLFSFLWGALERATLYIFYMCQHQLEPVALHVDLLWKPTPKPSLAPYAVT